MMPCFLVEYYPFFSYVFNPFLLSYCFYLLQHFFFLNIIINYSSVVRLYLNQQVVGHFLLFNVPSADLAHSCDILETAVVSPFLACLFKLAAKQTVLFNHCDLGE